MHVYCSLLQSVHIPSLCTADAPVAQHVMNQQVHHMLRNRCITCCASGELIACEILRDLHSKPRAHHRCHGKQTCRAMCACLVALAPSIYGRSCKESKARNTLRATRLMNRGGMPRVACPKHRVFCCSDFDFRSGEPECLSCFACGSCGCVME